MEREKYKEHQSGMPDSDYFRMIHEAEYAWNHRMEPDPLEPWTTENSDPATALNKMSFKGGPNSGITNPEENFSDEDPKFENGRHPQFER